MTSPDSIPADAVLVAIDIAKVRNEVLIDVPCDRRRRRLVVLNTRLKHDRLIAVLRGYKSPVSTAARRGFPRSATQGRGAPYGSLGKWPSASARTAFVTSSNATSPKTATMPIGAARR